MTRELFLKIRNRGLELPSLEKLALEKTISEEFPKVPLTDIKLILYTTHADISRATESYKKHQHEDKAEMAIKEEVAAETGFGVGHIADMLLGVYS